MEYRIIRSKTLESLEEEVNAALEDGWVPTGGPMNLHSASPGTSKAWSASDSLDGHGPPALVRDPLLLDARELVMQDPGNRPDLSIAEAGDPVAVLD